ncbi:MAG: polysaccharide biosynthesis tyrosine autokinase [Candidatus Omnitrophota bacterium]
MIDTFYGADYKDVLRKRMPVIIIFFIAVVGVVMTITFTATPIYRATATLLIDIESPNVLTTTVGVETANRGYYSYYAYKDYFMSQLGIITSYSIGQEVLDEIGLEKFGMDKNTSDPVKEFLSSVSVEAVANTRLVNLNFDSEKASLAARTANRIAEVYTERNLIYISKNERLNLLKNEYLRLQTKLSEFSKIYKEKHPEMIRIRQEMEEVVGGINREKEAVMGMGSLEPSAQYDLKAFKANNVSIIDYARIPTKPIKPNVLINTIAAIFVGLFGGIGLAFFFEYQDATVKDVEDLEKITDWQFLGKVPKISGIKKELHAERKPDDFITESYRSVRTQLMFLSTKEHPLKTIVVSSIGQREGKTTTVCNLGIAIAHNNKKVLIVDADMYKPRLHEVFHNKKSKGLCSFLGGQNKFEDVVQESSVKNLYYIADSHPCHNSSELISGERMSKFMELCKERFDFIIFDSPPIGLITDARVLAAITDGVVLILESGKTPKKAIVRTRKLLASSKINCLGAVIIKVPTSGSEGYYYSYAYK